VTGGWFCGGGGVCAPATPDPKASMETTVRTEVPPIHPLSHPRSRIVVLPLGPFAGILRRDGLRIG
jgi:hypothetical protein